MRNVFRNKVAAISSYLEIILSVVILVGITIMSVQLILDIVMIVRGISNASMAIPFEKFMGDALKLIIGIEFVKMLINHTPESVIEVLLFAMARKLIVGSSSSLDVVIGIGSIAVLFVVRRFLFDKQEKSLLCQEREGT
ncbi:phosphate-starvation-inducible PsiE family protein [Lacrimispora sp.]|uniref:phosphate-starvation-inducible PsiE family protein n=1 Tax=Lacrimispora sp. TaxID=2719234 RepID=UPI00345FBAA8